MVVNEANETADQRKEINDPKQLENMEKQLRTTRCSFAGWCNTIPYEKMLFTVYLQDENSDDRTPETFSVDAEGRIYVSNKSVGGTKYFTLDDTLYELLTELAQ